MKKNAQKIFCLFLSSFFIFSGCGKIAPGDGTTQVKVAFWGSPEEIDIITHSISEWQQAHPNIKFVIELDAGLPFIDMDVEQMSRVLVNIIDNAIASIESSNTKDGEIIINTNFDRELEIVQLTIADNGIGVGEQDKPRVFEPYFSTKKQGTGLGLAIVSTIIADHHGYVRLRDNAPRGAMFIIEFPSSTRSAEKAEEKALTKGNRSRD